MNIYTNKEIINSYKNKGPNERLVKFFEILLEIDYRVNKSHESGNKNVKTRI